MVLMALAVQAAEKNETAITDPFEDDEDLRFAADEFCQQYVLSNPQGKVAIPYKPDCHFWWQCNAYELKKHECQGKAYRITLHYDLYLDRCEEPAVAKCTYRFDEEEIVMERIMDFYKKQVPETTSATKKKKKVPKVKMLDVIANVD